MYKLAFKRIFDFCGAFLLIIIFAPVMIWAYFAVKKHLGAPVIFTQMRPGLDEKIFKIYKFRTMSDDKDKNGELLSDEARLNNFGKMLRNTSIDELPQLFNVLRGDMSFIGPRPLLIEYLSLYNKRQKLRHSVRPGITGLAQVSGRNNISWAKKLELDSYYAQHLSFLLDVKIAFLTIKKVLKKEGINQDGMQTTQKFNGNN